MSTASKMAEDFFNSGENVVEPTKEVFDFVDAVMAIAKREKRKVRSIRAIVRHIKDNWPNVTFGRERLCSYLKANHNEQWEAYYKGS